MTTTPRFKKQSPNLLKSSNSSIKHGMKPRIWRKCETSEIDSLRFGTIRFGLLTNTKYDVIIELAYAVYSWRLQKRRSGEESKSCGRFVIKLKQSNMECSLHVLTNRPDAMSSLPV